MPCSKTQHSDSACRVSNQQPFVPQSNILPTEPLCQSMEDDESSTLMPLDPLAGYIAVHSCLKESVTHMYKVSTGFIKGSMSKIQGLSKDF